MAETNETMLDGSASDEEDLERLSTVDNVLSTSTMKNHENHGRRCDTVTLFLS